MVKHRASGFSLLEIMVAIAIMGVLTFAVVPQMRFLADLQSEHDTKTRLTELITGMRAAYKVNIATIDGDELAVINFGARGNTNPSTATADQRCNSTTADYSPWSEFTGQAAGVLARDGYGAPFCIFINARSSMLIDGVTVYYHSIAFVSGGRNNVLDAGTALDGQGNLALAGDDIGMLFDGRKLATERYNTTVENMRRVVSAYEQYFASRFASDPSKSTSINYFACGDNTTCPPGAPVPRWDSGGSMPTTCGGSIPLYSTTGISPHAVLGLSRSDVTDGFGTVMKVDNCTDNVRSPNHSGTDNMKIPPYTAAVTTTIPGGQTITQTAISSL